MTCRRTVRTILGYYTEPEKPSELVFVYNKFGKPSLVQCASSGSKIDFSIAHSCGLLLFAVSLDQEIGVDLEQKKPFKEMERFVERFFSREEVDEFHSLSSEKKKLEFFYALWTSKEAYSKATGLGLRASLLDEMEASCKALQTGGGFLKLNLPEIPGYATALVVKGSLPKVLCVFGGERYSV